MKDADDTDAVFLWPFEHYITPMLHTHQPGTDCIAISSQSGPIGMLLQAGLKVAKVSKPYSNDYVLDFDPTRRV